MLHFKKRYRSQREIGVYDWEKKKKKEEKTRKKQIVAEDRKG